MSVIGEKTGESGRTQDDSVIFALDIGTRTVIGIVASIEGPKLKILAQSMVEHESRAVYDGQIHDIFKATLAVRKVKNALEEKLGYRLEKVAIAAAGRSLKTVFAHHEQEIGDDIEIETAICRGLEMDAVKEAQKQLQAEDGDAAEDEEYYCVGYTVVNYYLNNYTITNLIGHNGKKIGVDVLATFLPESVVNSLYAVLERVDLEPVSLTLEPIAAASAIIPETYRLLNLALIDVGAGTSDIAITRDGSVVAYGMVPVAGDEITEALSQGLLVDFNTGEMIKRQLSNGKDIIYNDIMGIENTVSCESVMDVLDPVLETLTEKVTAEILRLNGDKPPKSVFCVGGGGQLPEFTGKIAAKLGLAPERVGIRGRKFIPDLLVSEDQINGPEGVTVVGIAKVALDKVGHNFITLNVNGKDYRLFHSKRLTALDALGLIEYNLSDLTGKNGKNLRFVLNGERKVVYGGLCKAARLFLNGKESNLKVELNDGDCMMVEKAVSGQDARAYIKDYTGDFSLGTLRVDGRMEEIGPQCFINGGKAEPAQEIAEGDRVELRKISTVSQLAEYKGLNIDEYEVVLNGDIVSADKEIADGDSIDFRRKNIVARPSPAHDVPDGGYGGNYIRITVNNQPITLKNKTSYIFVDVFNHVDMNPYKTPGKKVNLLLNGDRANYTSEIKDGDVIEIGWE